MKTRLEFEVETLRELLKAGVEAMDAMDRIGGLTRYSQGWRDRSYEIMQQLDRILKEVSE